MKRVCKFLTIPVVFADSGGLSVNAKWVAITLDSYVDNPNGTSMGLRAIQTATNLSAKEVKDAMTELYEHGAMEVTVCDGQKFWKPLLYRDSYTKVVEKPMLGDKPTDSEPIDYAYIQAQWNTICHMLPKMEKFTPRRKQKTRTCLKGAGALVSDLIKAFKLIATSAFLNGSKSSEWQCGYDWVIKSPDNLTKILEGQYHRDYPERRAFETIMNGGEVGHQQKETDFYK